MDRQEDVLLEQAEKLWENLSLASREITKEFVNHKVDLVKDINTISAILLPAFLVLIKEEFIKNQFLFWIGIFTLALLLIVNLIYRRSLFSKEEELLKNMQTFGQKLQNKITDCKMKNKQEDFKQLDGLLQESFKPLVKSKNFLQKYGEIGIYILFICGIVLLAMSLFRF